LTCIELARYLSDAAFTVSSLEVTAGEHPALQILLSCLQQFAGVTLALASAPFGIPATPFWIYVCASLLFIIGLIKILKELPQEHGVDKIMPEGNNCAEFRRSSGYRFVKIGASNREGGPCRKFGEPWALHSPVAWWSE